MNDKTFKDAKFNQRSLEVKLKCRWIGPKRKGTLKFRLVGRESGINFQLRRSSSSSSPSIRFDVSVYCIPTGKLGKISSDLMDKSIRVKSCTEMKQRKIQKNHWIILLLSEFRDTFLSTIKRNNKRNCEYEYHSWHRCTIQYVWSIVTDIKKI